jgi:hypothetical protein
MRLTATPEPSAPRNNVNPAPASALGVSGPHDCTSFVTASGFATAAISTEDQQLCFEGMKHAEHCRTLQNRAARGLALGQASGRDPNGTGLARVSVMDARGATDSVLVRLE